MNIIRLLHDCVPGDRVGRVTLLLTLPAAAVPLVPFVYDISPAYAVYESIRLMSHGQTDLWVILLAALSLFSGWLVLAARLRLQVRKLLSPRTRASAGLAAITSAILSLSIVGMGFYEKPSNRWEFAGMLSAPVIIVAGVVLLVRRRRRHASVDRNAVLALEVAFLAHAVMLALLFRDNQAIGWWLTIIAAVGVLGDLIAAASPKTDLLHPSVPDVSRST